MSQKKNEIANIETEAKNFLTTQIAPVIADYAIREYKHQNFIKSAMIAISTDDKLQEALATKDGKAGIVNAIRMAAGTGLSLNPQEGKAALVCYNKKINDKWVPIPQYQVMKNGLIELALESGKVEFITADTVRDKDDFSVKKTMDGDQYEFSPARKDRGDIDGFFAAVKMKDGTCHVKYMTIGEVTDHRQQFSEKTKMPEEGYGQKTILKKLLNSLHICAELDQAVGADNYRDEEPVDITPVQEKGTSADDLAENLKDKATDAEIVEPEQMELDGGEGEGQKKDSVI
jgi:phage RecT family recombinase